MTIPLDELASMALFAHVVQARSFTGAAQKVGIAKSAVSKRIASLEGVLEVGQEIDVKLVDIDKKTGKYHLSRKVLLDKPA